MKNNLLSGVALALLASPCAAFAAAQAPRDAAAIAAAFGARPYVESAALSPDGNKVVFITPAAGPANIAVITDLKTGENTPTMGANGKPMKLSDCGWSAGDRLVCSLYGVGVVDSLRLSYRRLFAFDADGKHQISLARGGVDRLSTTDIRMSQYDGEVIDWLSGSDGFVLMTRDFVPQQTTGTLMLMTRSGFGVERVNTRDNSSQIIEQPQDGVDGYFADGNGVVRMMALGKASGTGMLTGTTVFKYRLANDRAWRAFSSVAPDGPGLRPVAVDGSQDIAYALQKSAGRDALYKVALDGSMKADLIYADPHVDVDGVATIGRRDRIIGVTYTTDQPNVKYIDPEYSKLVDHLSKTLPNSPLIEIVSASTDERKLIILAAGPSDPGRYYLLDRETHALVEIAPARPELVNLKLSEVKSITFPAADGTLIPAYLTLPPGSDGKNLPALVLPHGGPSARDYGGFDFLSQFFAQRGFAVIQPEFRGSIGFGEAWGTFLKNNGFKSWRTAIGDIDDAGRWLVKQGIADPDKLAIFGWSYGGYAALQSNVVDPALFKAAIAVAPLTDFGMAKDEARHFTNYNIVNQQIGEGAVVEDGSPDRHASAFQAPVLMFHGDNDLNVSIAESRAMDAALHHAGKQSRLVVYPGLDHQLDDSKARADMLAQSDAFLRTALHIAN